MKFGSVCSGIEAASVAWEPLGWKASFFSEIEKFPSELLATHYPDVPNYGDMTKYKEWKKDGTVGLIVGGTPCQSFSVAGLRKGLEDPRGNLMLTFGGILKKYQPTWMVWENVPGVLSSNKGRDFGTFLGMLGKCGYGFAYRVLDAQYFGVAQRRRRVFVVGYLGDWKRAAAVLFEPESLQRDLAKGRKKGKVAPTLPASGSGTSRTGNNIPEKCPTLTANLSKQVDNQMLGDAGAWFHVINRDAFNASESWMKSLRSTSTTDRLIKTITPESDNSDNKCPTLTASEPIHAVAIPETDTPLTVRQSSFGGWTDDGKAGTIKAAGGCLSIQGDGNTSLNTNGCGYQEETSYTLNTVERHSVAYSFDSKSSNSMKSSNPYSGCREVQLAKTIDTTDQNPSKNQGGIAVAQNNMAVRRLTPNECEVLQGFPRDYTDLNQHKLMKGKYKPDEKRQTKQTADGPRYKALGNSMAVPVMRWIGERIQQVEETWDG